MDKTKYHIGIRLRGYPKDYIKSLTCKLGLNFGIEEYQTQQIVPHITLLRPFYASNEQTLIDTFQQTLSKIKESIFFKINGFGIFKNEIPIFYASIEPNKAIEKIAIELNKNLENQIKYKFPQATLPGEENILKLHSSILTKGTKDLGNKIEILLNSQTFFPVTQPLLRVYLLKTHEDKKNLILREYDFYLERSLTRLEAIDPFLFKETKKAFTSKTNFVIN